MHKLFKPFLISRRIIGVLRLIQFNHSLNGRRYFSSSLNKTSFSPVQIMADNIRIHFQHAPCEFPFVWLRDNCQCQECFHSDSKSRIINWQQFNVNIKPESVVTNANEKKVLIKWKDNHTSIFCLNWLYDHKFTSENRQHYLSNIYKPQRITWNKDEFEAAFKPYDFVAIIEKENHLKDWLETLSTYGMALITNVPSSDDSCKRIANRVEFIKRTHYGEQFVVMAKPGTTNVAYLSRNLQMHTDLPYYEYKPGVNLLHCVTQSMGKGGENLLSDGLHAAHFLKMHDPESYKVLSQTLVDWEDYGHEDGNKFHSIFRSPVICEDLEGEIIRINHSVPQRGSHFNIPVEKVKPWYRSMKTFIDIIHENAATYKVSPGEMLCFDNRRLLHGRLEYQDTTDNTRHVIGAYLDWDYIFSRMRVLGGKYF